MTKVILGISTEPLDLALMDLSNSPIYAKIPSEHRADYALGALSIGSKKAEEWVNHSLPEILKKHHIDVVMKSRRSVMNTVMLRGEVNFTRKISTITIYEDSIRSLLDEVMPRLPKQYRMTEQQVIAMHLAHEFFHFLEFKDGEYVGNMLPSVTLIRILGWSRYAAVSQCSEIAAHAFAQRYCKMDVLPVFYDFIYSRSSD